MPEERTNVTGPAAHRLRTRLPLTPLSQTARHRATRPATVSIQILLFALGLLLTIVAGFMSF